jgi:hypothetical protein
MRDDDDDPATAPESNLKSLETAAAADSPAVVVVLEAVTA